MIAETGTGMIAETSRGKIGAAAGGPIVIGFRVRREWNIPCLAPGASDGP